MGRVAGVGDLKTERFAPSRIRTPIPQQCSPCPSRYTDSCLDFSTQINLSEWCGGGGGGKKLFISFERF